MVRHCFALSRPKPLFTLLTIAGLFLLSGCAPSAYQAHVKLGNEYLNAMSYQEAEREFREALRLRPNDAKMHCALGIVLDLQGKYEEAEKEHREAVRLKPGCADGLRSLAYFLDRQGRRKEARPYWERALKAEKDRVECSTIRLRLAERD